MKDTDEWTPELEKENQSRKKKYVKKTGPRLPPKREPCIKCGEKFHHNIKF